MNLPFFEMTEGLSSSILFAYIDPNSGHTFLQLIVAGVVGIPLAMGRAVRRFFSSLLHREPASMDASRNQH